MQNMEKELIPVEQNDFELSLRVLGNEVFALRLSASSVKNKWLLVSLVSFIALMTGLVLFGEDLAKLFQAL